MHAKIKIIGFFTFLFGLAPFALAEGPWDALRPISQTAYEFDPAVKALVFLASLGLLGIALLAYKKTKSKRALFVAAAFFLFAVKWGLKMVDLFISPGTFFADTSENVVELLIFAFLFLALFKK